MFMGNRPERKNVVSARFALGKKKSVNSAFCFRTGRFWVLRVGGARAVACGEFGAHVEPIFQNIATVRARSPACEGACAPQKAKQPSAAAAVLPLLELHRTRAIICLSLSRVAVAGSVPEIARICHCNESSIKYPFRWRLALLAPPPMK